MSIVIGEMKVVYTSKQDVVKRPRIAGSEDAVRFCKELYDPGTIEHHEEFWCVYLNRCNGVIGWAKIGMGSAAACTVCPRMVMQYALLANASGIILTHNHPSGSVQPSRADDQVTERIKECAKVFDVQVVDHVIIAPFGGWYSYADMGRM